ncbi:MULTISPECIES: cytochrome c biogenesis CcdA family protein [Subtercola]|uniref:Uncharacterized protein n=1 Tax=Subtercola vilae TaxID=2056433 RepID=A0A4T2C8P0_9MICO|nr:MULTISPECIES: cytochrome c biogenesis protein CcdA [Subtercola]MEA9983833.1 cytochrome c biogenesis protein CcdA [Subtercola sp. RTI3]TIH40627.1 hypothetical protein D4765_01180 [Subtercola vilae]
MSYTVVGYAFALGLVGVLNPCGFPLLPAYLTLFVTRERVRWPQRLMRGLGAGLCMTAGFLLVFTIVGLVTASAVSVVLACVPWLMIAVGGALVVVGVITVTGRSVAVHLPSLAFRSGTGVPAILGFGASYAVGSLSCSLPLFLAGVFGAFVRGSFVNGLSAFVAYGLGMGVFVTTLSIVAAFAGGNAVRVLRPLTRILSPLAGAVLVTSGGYLVFYWLHDLIDPAIGSGLITAVQTVQSAMASGLGAAALPVGAGLGFLVVAALALVTILAARSESTIPKGGTPDA